MFTRFNYWTTLPFAIAFFLNSFLSITTLLGNTLILIALHKESSLHPPSRFLLRGLAASTDLCVDIFAEPLTVTYWMSEVNEHWNICPYFIAAALTIPYILCGVSVGTLTVISVDRLIALLLGLRYRGVVTMGFACCLFSNVVLGSSYKLLVCHHLYHTVSYNPCFLVHKDFPHPPSSSKSSTRPCSTTRNQTNQVNIARYKKAVFSAIWLQLTLVACYLPHGVAAALVANSGLTSSVYLAGIYYNHSSLLKLVV